MTPFIEKLLKFVPLVPLGVLAVSGLAAYISLQNKVEALTQQANKFSPEAVLTRLGYVEKTLEEMKQDLKEVLRNQRRI